jgi:hypothetical protein
MHHLSKSAAQYIIRYRRDGRSLIYAAEYGAMNSLLDYLTENCCQGSACDVKSGPARRGRNTKGVNSETLARPRRR